MASLTASCFDSIVATCWGALGWPSETIRLGDRSFSVVRQLGEGGYSFVYLVREDATLEEFACKKVLAQTGEALDATQAEIAVMERLSHPALLPLLAHGCVEAPGANGEPVKSIYMLLPCYAEGTLEEAAAAAAARGRNLPPAALLKALLHVAQGLQAMHSMQPPLAHRDVKPQNCLVKGLLPIVAGGGGAGYLPVVTAAAGEAEAAAAAAAGEEGVAAVLMDFGSTRPALLAVRSRQAALQAQEAAAAECSAPFRAPELWDVPSSAALDSRRSDVWALGCTLYAGMYGVSPFEYALRGTGGSLALAILSGRVKWPAEEVQHFPKPFHELVTWMLQADPADRPTIDEVVCILRDVLAARTWEPKAAGGPEAGEDQADLEQGPPAGQEEAGGVLEVSVDPLVERGGGTAT